MSSFKVIEEGAGGGGGEWVGQREIGRRWKLKKQQQKKKKERK